MASLSGIARDIRALGTSAPVRAVYEASKRSGFHRVLFRDTAAGDHRSVPVPFGHHVPQSEVARERTLADARLILDEGVRVFGHRAPTGVHASWATDPHTLKEWPQQTAWWEIDIRTDARMSDVKHVWEAGRHRDLVVLARAAAIDPDGPWFDTLEQMFIRWCKEQTPEYAINWYSSLELALRAIAWNQVLALVGDRFPVGLRSAIDEQLVLSARHIMVELPYTMTSMKNNHMLGDGLGLVVIAAMFPTHPKSKRWAATGEKLMLMQLGRHMRPDGSMIEDSLSYHRFVLEMFIVRVLLGDAPEQTRQAMVDAAEHLVALGVLEGDVPQYGDWDEGRVLADSNPAGDVAGAVHLVHALSGRTLPASAADAYDEVAWYADAPGLTRETDGIRPNAPISTGDFITTRHGNWSVWLKASTSPSHQHADTSSVWIRHGDSWVVQDPGTGTYNGPIEVRNGFRTTQAHSVWQADGRDLLEPHRAFRWMRMSVPSWSVSGALGQRSVMAMAHTGYDATVARVVIVDESGVVIVDRLPAGNWRLTVPTGDARDELFGLANSTAHVGDAVPFAGWHSPTYSRWQESTWFRLTSAGGCVVWGAGAERTAAIDGDTVQVDGLDVAFTSESVVITDGQESVSLQKDSDA